MRHEHSGLMHLDQAGGSGRLFTHLPPADEACLEFSCTSPLGGVYIQDGRTTRWKTKSVSPCNKVIALAANCSCTELITFEVALANKIKNQKKTPKL